MTDTHSFSPLDHPHPPIMSIGFRDQIAPLYEIDPARFCRVSPYLK